MANFAGGVWRRQYHLWGKDHLWGKVPLLARELPPRRKGGVLTAHRQCVVKQWRAFTHASRCDVMPR
jgi:hypothetical protein